MRPQADHGTGRFGLFTLTTVVVASMIGAGVFTTSGFALEDLGTPGKVMLAWALGGFIALTGAKSYGMLVRRIPESGGEYIYLRETVHPLAGFIAGWVSLLAGFTGAIAFAASALESYLVPAGIRPDWLPQDIVALAAVLTAGVMHGLRAARGAFWQGIAVVFKVLIIAAFVVYAGYQLAAGAWPGGGDVPLTGTAAFSLPAFAMSLVWISLSYSGFNASAYMAGEAVDPRRTVPRSLVLGTLIVFAVYLALNSIFVLAPPREAVSGAADVAAVAARALGGGSFAAAARFTIVLALFTSVSSMVMAGPRVYAKMAEDGLMPKAFEVEEEPPREAIWFQVGLAVLFILLTGIQQLLSYLGFTLSLTSAAAVTGLFVIHHREGRTPSADRAYPWVPAVYVTATVGLAVLAAGENPVELAGAVATFLTGTLAYFVIRAVKGRGKRRS
ncbi:MAG: amino acid permease [bacterium]